MQGYLKRMGLTWRKTKSRKKRFNLCRGDTAGTHAILCVASKLDPDGVVVFIDESCIHKSHGVEFSYLDSQSEVNKSSSKGARMIILYDITEDSPLCKTFDYVQADYLVWKKDMPRSEEAPDGAKTAECLRMANSHTGDYHDNMDRDNFMRWTQEKCHLSSGPW